MPTLMVVKNVIMFPFHRAFKRLGIKLMRSLDVMFEYVGSASPPTSNLQTNPAIKGILINRYHGQLSDTMG